MVRREGCGYSFSRLWGVQVCRQSSSETQEYSDGNYDEDDFYSLLEDDDASDSETLTLQKYIEEIPFPDFEQPELDASGFPFLPLASTGDNDGA